MAKEKSGYGKIQMFFFLIFIPILFALFLGGVILSFLGFNVIETAKSIGGSIPVVSSFVEDEKDEDQLEPSELQATIQTYEQQLYQLEQQLNAKDDEIFQLELEIDQLEEQLEIAEEGLQVQQEEIAELAKTYENMSPEQAAAILEAMNNEEVLRHIAQLSSEARGEILEEMDAERAATILTMFAN